jgi:methylisocitrate lyase
LMASQVASAGSRLRSALEEEQPLQVVGVINAYAALMADRVGFRALYLSGAGVANYSHGMPDLGLTTLNDVLEEVRRITSVTQLPLLVDADTGWGGRPRGGRLRGDAGARPSVRGGRGGHALRRGRHRA